MYVARGFVTGCPESGDAVEPGLYLASGDSVAMDTVGMDTLRYYGTTHEVSSRIFEQEQIARAAESWSRR
jgi:uncharacterized protein (DUF362 family)